MPGLWAIWVINGELVVAKLVARKGLNINAKEN